MSSSATIRISACESKAILNDKIKKAFDHAIECFFYACKDICLAGGDVCGIM